MNTSYAKTWTVKESLESLNRRIHDRVLDDEGLLKRACFYHEMAFKELFPFATPKKYAKMLEVGGGVGWPLQAGIDLFGDVHITDLDISENMLENAQKRLAALPNYKKYANRCEFNPYDGLNFPYDDDTFDIVYSYATLWHIPEKHLFPILSEIKRVLKKAGHCILMFAALDGMNSSHFLQEQMNQIEAIETHYHFYHTPMKFYWWLVHLLHVTQFDAKKTLTWFDKTNASYYWIHFSKDSGKEILNPKIYDCMVSVEAEITHITSYDKLGKIASKPFTEQLVCKNVGHVDSINYVSGHIIVDGWSFWENEIAKKVSLLMNENIVCEIKKENFSNREDVALEKKDPSAKKCGFKFIVPVDDKIKRIEVISENNDGEKVFLPIGLTKNFPWYRLWSTISVEKQQDFTDKS